MRYLMKGGESAERFDLLVSLTKISSDGALSALRDHLVTGLDERDCVALNDVNQPNFSRALSRLNKVAETVEKIKEIDFKHIR